MWTKTWWNFPVELAQPLHRERVGRDDQSGLDATHANQRRGDQTGDDRLAESDLVGEEPADLVVTQGARCRVELVSEELDTTADQAWHLALLPEAAPAAGYPADC